VSGKLTFDPDHSMRSYYFNPPISLFFYPVGFLNDVEEKNHARRGVRLAKDLGPFSSLNGKFHASTAHGFFFDQGSFQNLLLLPCKKSQDEPQARS